MSGKSDMGSVKKGTAKEDVKSSKSGRARNET